MADILTKIEAYKREEIAAARRARPYDQVEEAAKALPPTRGFLAAITNPKTIAFFTAFLPQFIDPALPASHQLLVMCSVAITMAALTDCAWGVVAGAGRSFFLQRVSTKWLGRLSGTVLIGGGVWLSLARRPG